jgi:hypothetical protein
MMVTTTGDMTTSGLRPSTLRIIRGPRRRCTLAPRPIRGPAQPPHPPPQTRATEGDDHHDVLTVEVEDPAEAEAMPPPPVDAHMTMIDAPTATTGDEDRGEEDQVTTMVTAAETILGKIVDMPTIRLRLAKRRKPRKSTSRL